MGAVVLQQGSRRFEDGIWRVRDIDLAVYLGYANPRQIRERIKRNLDALEELGEIRRLMVRRPEGGAAVEEFWLTKKQALFIAARGETEKSDEVLIMLVDHFDAVERGVLVAQEQTPEIEVLRAERNEIVSRLIQIENAVRIVDGDGTRTKEFEIDHYSGRHHRKLTDTWAVCHKLQCAIVPPLHLLAAVLLAFNRLKNPEFVAYQNTLKAFQDPGPMFRDLYD